VARQTLFSPYCLRSIAAREGRFWPTPQDRPSNGIQGIHGQLSLPPREDDETPAGSWYGTIGGHMAAMTGFRTRIGMPSIASGFCFSITNSNLL